MLVAKSQDSDFFLTQIFLPSDSDSIQLEDIKLLECILF